MFRYRRNSLITSALIDLLSRNGFWTLISEPRQTKEDRTLISGERFNRLPSSERENKQYEGIYRDRRTHQNVKPRMCNALKLTSLNTNIE